MKAEVQFKVSDEDTGSDDIVGEGKCTLAELCAKGGFDGNFDIKHKDSVAGTVHFITSFGDKDSAKAKTEADQQPEPAATENGDA